MEWPNIPLGPERRVIPHVDKRLRSKGRQNGTGQRKSNKCLQVDEAELIASGQFLLNDLLNPQGRPSETSS